jgi:four helix bundle protein
MKRDSEAMKQRTKNFALRILKLYRSLPKTDEARILGRQVLRSGTSIGANYCAACRGDPAQNLRPNSELCWKKRTKQSFGWS